MPPRRLVSPSTTIDVFGGDAVRRAGLAEAAEPLVVDDHVGKAAEEGEPAMALARSDAAAASSAPR